MQITVKRDTDGVNWDEAAAVLHEAGLTQASPDHIRQAFENSRFVVFVYDEEKLVGVSRALSDGIDQGAIYNVALLEAYHGYGIGRILIDTLLEDMKGMNVILYTHPKTVGLYEKFSFRRSKTAMVHFDEPQEDLDWMEKTGFFLPEGYRFCDEYGREDMKYRPPHKS